jgi:hypothetical protein
MTQEEASSTIAEAQERVGIRDPQHLYIPGKVILMYEKWNSENYSSEHDLTEDENEHDEKKCNDAETPSADLGEIHDYFQCHGTTKALRFFEIDRGRAITDHMTSSYYHSIETLLSEQEEREKTNSS